MPTDLDNREENRLPVVINFKRGFPFEFKDLISRPSKNSFAVVEKILLLPNFGFWSFCMKQHVCQLNSFWSTDPNNVS